MSSAAEPEVSYEDYNFDGHPDKKVLTSKGGGRYTANETYEISLYNPATKTYILNEGLSELCSPWAEPKTKQIHSYVRGGTRSGVLSIFEWREQKLLLVKKETTTEEGAKLLTITERLIDGKMTVVSKTFIDSDSEDKAQQDGVE